jgi:hypothetical protein
MENFDMNKEFKIPEVMSPNERTLTNESRAIGKIDVAEDRDYHGIDTRTIPSGADVVYERKVAVMNQALIDMGMGSFQWNVFAMTGFGWFVDNVRVPCPTNAPLLTE